MSKPQDVEFDVDHVRLLYETGVPITDIISYLGLDDYFKKKPLDVLVERINKLNETEQDK